jgi:hypothetical protein
MHVLGKKRASDFSYVHPFFSNGEQKYLIPNHLQTYPEFTFERDAFVEISETTRPLGVWICLPLIPNEPNQAQAIQPAHIRGFLDELKDNNSFEELQVDTINVILTRFDLGHFLQNNANIKDLTWVYL